MEGSSSEKHGCVFNGRFLSNGTEQCTIDFCVVCEDGKLKVPRELSRDEKELLVDPGEAYFVPV